MTPPRTFGLTACILTTSLCAQWQQGAPATTPGARSGAGMCFDGSRVLMFGGAAGFSASNETWAYNGTDWALLAPTATPNAAQGMELVHDPIRGVAVRYGGLSTSFFGGPSVDETWEFDGTTWTQVFPTTTPGGLGNYGAAYDLGRQRLVLYGGSANSFFPIAEAGTWEFDGTTWALRSTVGTPGPLERPAMCFHLALNKIVLFGGIDPQIGGVDTTWTYDGTTWTALTITGPKPAARTGADLVYDSVRGVAVLTGGIDPMTGVPFTDTWEFNGAAWDPQPTTTQGQYDAGMAFLATGRQVVRFGGIDPSTFSTLDDTFLYGSTTTAFGTGCAGSNGTPALTASDTFRLGATQTLTLANLATGSAFALMVVGFSDSVGTLGNLPLSLAPFGMPGCTGYVSSEAVLLIGATAGQAQFVGGVPNDLGFLGLRLFHQGLGFDATANAGGITTSNALASVVGY